jgi:hypothetical protein
MSEELKEIKNMLEKLDMRSRRIENVLTGDKDFKIQGMVDKVDYHSEKIKEFETDKVKIVTATTILAAIAGFLSSLFHKIFS